MAQTRITPDMAEARNEPGDRAPWQRPELRKISAGSAEVAPGIGVPDGGFS